uniref:Uncharacterized protein n=1 Tax=Staphylothermus marinus TaxID=2280 RepID=A0A7C4NLC6_STAMA
MVLELITECIVNRIEKLLVPQVYRVHASCREGFDTTIEVHEKLMNIREDDKIKLEITESKESCLQHYFCGKAYVVSTTMIENRYRVVLSIGGLLVVLKNLHEPPQFNVLSELYVGITRVA